MQKRQHASPNWDSQFSSEQPVASWKLRRQAVRCPGRQRSTMKWPRDLPVALTLSLYSSYACCICTHARTLNKCQRRLSS